MSMQSITTWSFSPEEPMLLAARFSDKEGTVFFYSGDSQGSSYLCLFPEKKITSSAQPGCWENIQKQLGEFGPEGLPIPRFVGYLGYELGAFCDPQYELPYFEPEIPACCFYRPSVVICFDHASGIAHLYSNSKQPLDLNGEPPCYSPSHLEMGSRSDTLESYLQKIKQAKEWILEGEIYQVNLSQEMRFKGSCAPFDCFQRLCQINPAPFSAFLNCGTFSIVCSSPERFLKKTGSVLETRPIKGTAPRGRTPEEDQENLLKLLASEKENAELLMITDLMRNDLGKVALPGTVKVLELCKHEAYSNVFHLLSIIQAEVAKDASAFSILRSLFPAGSITGCPKLKAIELIAKLEKRPRGLYTGSIGYLAENEDFDFNVAIRTLIVHPNFTQLNLGGGIVIDSDPVLEFEETLHKGSSLFNVLGVKP